MGGSLGLVVMVDDSCSTGRGFESRILDGHFLTLICCIKRPEINEKEAGYGPLKTK